MPNTIAQNLARLVAARTAIANAIINKGGTVNEGDGFEEFPDDIASIMPSIKVYGYHIDPEESDPDACVTYLRDSVGMTPASMGSTTFDYGSWKDTFFMPKPCMVKYDGTLDYYLDENDYKYKANDEELTGTLPLTFNSRVAGALKNYRIHGTSEGAGVETENLFDIETQIVGEGLDRNGSTVPSQTSNRSDYIAVDAETAYTQYNNVIDATYRIFQFFDANKEFLSDVGVTSSNRAHTFTTPQNCAFCRIAYPKNSTNVMLTEGSTAPTTYIPFGYKIPILNTSGVTENLLNPENVEKGRIDDGVVGYQSGTSALTWDNSTNRINYTITTQYRGFVTEIFDVVPNSYYTLNYTLSDDITTRMAFYNSSDEWLNEDIIVYFSHSRPYTITIPNDASKMRIAFVATNSGNHYIETPMLVKGSTAPDHYIPHRYTSGIPIYIGSTKLGAEEYVDYGEQKVYKRTANFFDVSKIKEGRSINGGTVSVEGNEIHITTS
jgi:hypothetical protein